MTDRLLARRARRVLLGNWRGGSTVPAGRLYPHQWSWDSAFIALGLRHLSPLRAQRELESLFGAQWADGRVPQIVFDPATPADAYFPGPDFWGLAQPGTGLRTSGLIQPPVHALAAWEVFLADPDTARRRRFLHRLYPRLRAWHQYLTRRDLRGDGLVSVVHPWESGMDNSPSWDEPLARIEPAPAGSFVRRDLDHSTRAGHGERPTDDDYGRYVRLAADYRDRGFPDRLAEVGFAVADPLTNALLAAGEHALAAIAAEVGADPAAHTDRAAAVTSALVSSLWDAESGIFFARDEHTGALLRQATVGGLTPLLVPDLPVADALVRTAQGGRFRLGQVAPVPSYDLTGPAYEPARYWRGPGWYNTGWLIWRGLREHGRAGLADALCAGMLDSVRRAGFREYVEPFTGAGHGADDFSWTAAVVLDLLAADDRTGDRTDTGLAA